MAITTGTRISITMLMNLHQQDIMNVWSYNVLELVGTPTAVNYGEAWWNHVKTVYRSLAIAGFGNVFKAVRVTELGNSAGEYGEFPIPTGEQAGTRANPTDAQFTPLFTAAGIRLTVGTRLTRPGQKRIPFLLQEDAVSQDITPGFISLLNTFMGTMKTNMTLGAPAAGVVLVPSVVGLNPDGSVRASQVVTGYVIDTVTTTQVSRRVGRGM